MLRYVLLDYLNIKENAKLAMVNKNFNNSVNEDTCLDSVKHHGFSHLERLVCIQNNISLNQYNDIKENEAEYLKINSINEELYKNEFQLVCNGLSDLYKFNKTIIKVKNI